MGEHASNGVEVGVITVVEHAVVDELDGGEAHRNHEILGLRMGDQRSGGIHLNVGLGHHRSDSLVLGINGKAF
jgi:hypothetical protein